MKTLLNIAVLLLCISSNSFSQNDISISDFLQLRANNNYTVESRLSALNIQPYDEEIIGSGRTQYTFQAENKSTPLQWVDFIYEQDAAWNNRISFQTQNLAQVKKYLTEMKSLGFYFVAKKIVDRQAYEVYSDGSNTIELITSQSRKVYDNNLYVNFGVYSAGEYEYAFASENEKYNVAQFNKEELFADLVGLPIK